MTDIQIEVWRVFWLCFGIVGTVIGGCCVIIFALSMSALTRRPPDPPGPWMPPHSRLRALAKPPGDEGK
jgi:hypothetical protein